ncbi:protein asteroid [Manduca sexta]|uniref:protein asteroid n=1 Tax=Manduca sexta TaxID=7130 RepID=UPI00188EE6F7|nr:protein asteroid [Manduca sexta]
MGVRGLTTYINYNEDVFLKTFLLHDTCLIIDGHSLCAQLYRSLNCFSAFGGDYDKFAGYVKTFFKNLRKCRVTAYILFDGSHESRKLKTAYTRLRSKICGASRLDPVTQGGLQIFPMFLRDVFKEIFRDMEIPYTICEFEADDEIAAMARHLNCPVLSYDSDFFIYNVLYIPFNTLDLKPTLVEENGNKVFVLECKIYRVEQLTKHFGGLKEEMLPLLATLLGNDYVEKRVFNKFFSQLKMPKSKKKKNEQQRCIHGLFKWLQNETLETAISKILGRLKKKQKARVLSIMKKSIEGYYKKHCRSLEYFNIADNIAEETIEFEFPDIVSDNDQFADEEIENEKDTDNVEKSNYEKEIDDVEGKDNETQMDKESDSETEEEALSDEENSKEDSDIEDQLILGLPEWFAKGIRKNYIPHSYINLYTHCLHFCSPQAEDYQDKDSFFCTLPILRYAFDIMTDYSRENCIYVSREKDNAYRRILIDQEYSVPRPFDILFQDLSEDQLKSCFHHFIKEKMPLLDMCLIDLLPPNFQIFMVSLLWWVQKCDIPLGNVHSLFISYIMLDVIDEKTGTFRGSYYFKNKYSKKIEEFKKNSSNESDDGELFLNKNKVQYEDCMIAASALLAHFELDDKIRKRPKSYDIRKIHSFAQFQCCLSQFNNLNQLCRKPFENTTYSKCYNGTFVYNIATKLENQIDPVSYFDQYLRGAVTVLRFYKSLCQIYSKCADSMGLVNKKWEGKKQRRKKNNNIDEELNFIVKGFESEVVI